jgi:hypothetical protein
LGVRGRTHAEFTLLQRCRHPTPDSHLLRPPGRCGYDNYWLEYGCLEQERILEAKNVVAGRDEVSGWNVEMGGALMPEFNDAFSIGLAAESAGENDRL